MMTLESVRRVAYGVVWPQDISFEIDTHKSFKNWTRLRARTKRGMAVREITYMVDPHQPPESLKAALEDLIRRLCNDHE